MKKALTSAILCLASLLALAQIPNLPNLPIIPYSFSQHTIGNGLDCQSLTALAKDCYGRLWIGSNVGLSIVSNGNVTNIKDIQCEGGHIVLGKVTSMVCNESALIASDDRIIHYFPQGDSACIVRYNDAVLYSDGFLLEGNVATFFDRNSQSLYEYDMAECKCRLVRNMQSDNPFNFTKIARAEDDSLNIYLADDFHGVFMLNRSTGKMDLINKIDRPISARTMVIDKTGTLWVAPAKGGVDGYFIKSGFDKIASYNCMNSNLPDRKTSLIEPLPEGNLLIGHHMSGISILQRNAINRGGIRIIRFEETDNITAVIVNQAKIETLLGTENHGLMSVRQSFIRQIQHMHEREIGVFSYENYFSAYEEPEGTVLLGSSESGIIRHDLRSGKETDFPSTLKIQAKYMCRFDNSNILIQDITGSLLLFNRNTGRCEPLSNSPLSDLLSTVSPEDVILFEASDDNLYVFNADSHHYLFKLNENKLYELDFKVDQEKTDGLVRNVCATPYATYVTINGLIIEINDNTMKTRLVYKNKDKKIHNITSLASTSVGDLYFTEPEGLHKYDPRSNVEELIVPAIGMGHFFNAIADAKDRIWFSTNTEYVQMYNPASKSILMFSVEDGITPSHFQNTWALCTKRGTILQPNVNGILTIDTNGDLMPDTEPEKIICMKAEIDKEDISKDILQKSIDRPFTLRPNYKELKIEISANAFNPCYSHIFMYNLYRNSQLVMSVNTMSTELSLPNLEAGVYTLEVRQAYRKGLSEPQTILSFKVTKAFYRTLPGVLLFLLTLSLFGYVIAFFSSSLEKNKMGKAMAEQSIKNREDKIAFLSNIAHELRTPLSLIYNPVKDFLQEKSVDGIDYERMERIFNQVNKMTVMVNMILDSSRADVNKADILVEDVNLNEWLNFLLEDYRIDCYGKGFSLKFIMDQSIGTVSIDKRIIETGLSNMVNNAIKYSKSGTTITVRTLKLDNMIRVSVSDQGRGFSCNPDDLFKRYYRENEDNSIPGYGLGLPYAKLQLSLIGGNMSAMNNENGIGSTFYMEFPPVVGKNGSPASANPDATEENRPNDASDSVSASTEEGMAQDFDTRNMTLMFVSSDVAEQEDISSEFQDQFRLVLTAGNGNDALSMLKRMNIDIVVSDIDITDMDGFELCRKIKGDIGISHLPVMLLTSRTDSRNRNMGYKMGADAFLARPFERKQLYNMIRSQLGGRFEIKRQYTFGFFSMMSPDQTFSMTDEQFISSVNNLISQNISDVSFSEDTIHDKLGIQRTVMLKKMEGLLGTTITGYIRRIRVNTVLEKLENSDDSLESLAAQTGFENVESMEKVFRKETGKDLYTVRQSQ